MEPSYRGLVRPSVDQQSPEQVLAHSNIYTAFATSQHSHSLQECYATSHEPVSWIPGAQPVAGAASSEAPSRWEQRKAASGNGKLTRAPYACARCRELKIKCELGSFSGEQAACRRCRAAQAECTFECTNSQPEHRDTFKDEILARMTALEARMHRLETRISQLPTISPTSSTSALPVVESASGSLEARLAYFEAQVEGFAAAPPHPHSEPPTPTSPFYPLQPAPPTQHPPITSNPYPSVLQPQAPPTSAPLPSPLVIQYPQHQSWEQSQPHHHHLSTSPVAPPPVPLPPTAHPSASAMPIDPVQTQDPSLPASYRPLTEIQRRLGQPFRYPTLYVEGVQGQQARGGSGEEGWGS